MLVATPIGNLGDLSPRAVETLKSASVIACEDTRHTRKLLNHAGISGVPVIAVHEHNEAGAAEDIVNRIQAGQTVAMVTDAGMPAISDPGERVVAAVAAAGLRVTVIPGASAMPAALAISGLPTDRFCFEGFLPRKVSERTARLRLLATEPRTSILYEAPHRLAAAVEELVLACGNDRRIVLVRELTKLHEEVWRGTCAGLALRLSASAVKGECVIVLEGAPLLKEATDADLVSALQEALSEGQTKRDAITAVSDNYAVPRNHVYDLAKTVPKP